MINPKPKEYKVCKNCGHEIEETVVGWLHTANIEEYHKKYVHICGNECINIKTQICHKAESSISPSLKVEQLLKEPIPKEIFFPENIINLHPLEQLARKQEGMIKYMARKTNLINKKDIEYVNNRKNDVQDYIELAESITKYIPLENQEQYIMNLKSLKDAESTKKY